MPKVFKGKTSDEKINECLDIDFDNTSKSGLKGKRILGCYYLFIPDSWTCTEAQEKAHSVIWQNDKEVKVRFLRQTSDYFLCT